MIGSAPRRGFTLIEMLVVLMIIGLFVGLASVIVQPDERALLRVEAERLARLLEFAATEAQLSGKYVAWTADGPGMRFWRSNGDSVWTEIRDGDVLLARTLPAGIAVSGLRVENMRPQGSMRLEFSPQGTALAFNVELSLGSARYVVSGSPIGEVRALPEEGKSHGSDDVRSSR